MKRKIPQLLHPLVMEKDEDVFLFIDINKVLSRVPSKRLYETLYQTRTKIYTYNSNLSRKINLKQKYTNS